MRLSNELYALVAGHLVVDRKLETFDGNDESRATTLKALRD
jgi:hypothetical protein